MNSVLTLILVANVTITSYRSVPSQTDSSPFTTSIGEKVCKDGIAVSQDLLKSGKVKYGDWLYIPGIGLKRVNDCMHHRWTNRADVWVATLQQEKDFHAKWKGKKVKVYKVVMK